VGADVTDEAEKRAKAALHHPLGDDDSVFGQRVGTDSGVWVVDEHDDRQVVSPTDSIFIYNEGGHNEDQAAHIARWDPATVLRLVERDRELINEWWSTKNAAGRLSDYGEGRLEILTEQVNAAAAFWVGTPEVDR
jgi:hypothetical protein